MNASLICREMCYAEPLRKKVILTVRTKDNTILYHTRKGLTSSRFKAWGFKSIKHGVKVARKRYSPMLGVNLVTWEVSTHTLFV